MGHSVIYMPECHSTNDEALQLVQKVNGTAEGTVVITDNQTAGRGQRGNTWVSEPGQNLTFSVILKPHFLSVPDQFLLNMVTSLALYDYLSGSVPLTDIRIKWPNDLLVDGNKIAGILVENIITGSQINCSVCGIGLNVNQIEWPFPAASIRHLLNQRAPLDHVFERLMEFLERRYMTLRAGGQKALRSDYLEVLYRRGVSHTYRSGTTEFYGTILGVDAIGRLQVETGEGVRTFGIKEIAY